MVEGILPSRILQNRQSLSLMVGSPGGSIASWEGSLSAEALIRRGQLEPLAAAAPAVVKLQRRPVGRAASGDVEAAVRGHVLQLERTGVRVGRDVPGLVAAAVTVL